MAASYESSTTKTPKKQKIRTVIRNAKEQDWTGISIVPDKGELVYASDVNTLKIGDGVTVYDNLPAISGGEQGTTNYTDLTNKPEINGVTLVGNVSLSDLGLANVASTGEYSDLINTPVLGTMAAENASDYTKTSSLSNVALTGSYDDLVNKPSFGTAAYANTTDFATAAQGNLATTAVQPSDLANVATTGSYDDLINKPYIPAGVVVDLTYDPNSTNAAAGTAVAEAVANKQDTLINGTNIKSINGNSLLGSGDLTLDGLPDQTGNSGKYLTTNGTTASWNNLANVAISGSYDDLVNTPVLGSMAYANTSDYTTTANLSNVALSGDYNDLTNKPVLGSAAYANTSDFATAAEGNLATTAVQPGDLANIAITGEYSDLINAPTLATVATTGEYSDLLNTPTIPAPQVQADWDQTNTSAVDYIKNKPYIPSGVTVDQTYNASSTNAQAGLAVAEAVATKSVVVLREW